MKLPFSPILLTLILTACKDSDKIKPESPEACNNADYVRSQEFKDVEMFVVTSTIFATTENVKIYFLSSSALPATPDYWIPCNLPEKFRKEKLAVRVSGNMLQYTESQTIISLGTSVELTRVEIR